MRSADRGTSRRAVLRSTAGLATAALAGSATGGVAAQSEPDYGGWFDDVSNYDGTVDRTGQDTVEITVGASGNNGNFAYGPAAVRVSPGTKVVWTWNGKGGAHNVVAEDGTFDSGSAVADSGTTFEYTFESEGVYKYACTPHKALGMKGAVVVDASGGGGGGSSGTPTEPDYGDWFSDVSNYDGTVDRTGQDTVEITVGASGNNGNFAYGPAAVRVSPGTKVVWTWNGKGGAHNVVAEDGTFDSGSAVADSGTTFEYTFESEGVYKYACTPHKALGMKGAVVVGGGAGGGGGGGEPAGELVWTPGLLMFAGSVVLGMLSPILFSAFLRFKHGQWERPQEFEPEADVEEEPAVPVAEEAPVEEADVELGHDEYDPFGTLSLIAVYFLILVVLWIFMYFVEFLGRGPTVIG
jgi:halocyanin-like protein